MNNLLKQKNEAGKNNELVLGIRFVNVPFSSNYYS